MRDINVPLMVKTRSVLVFDVSERLNNLLRTIAQSTQGTLPRGKPQHFQLNIRSEYISEGVGDS